MGRRLGIAISAASVALLMSVAGCGGPSSRVADGRTSRTIQPSEPPPSSNADPEVIVSGVSIDDYGAPQQGVAVGFLPAGDSKVSDMIKTASDVDGTFQLTMPDGDYLVACFSTRRPV